MTARRPLIEIVARRICRASGADPDQPVYRNASPESGVLYLKWKLYREQARAAIEGCRVARTRKVLDDAAAKLGQIDDQEARIVRERIDGLLGKLGEGLRCIK